MSSLRALLTASTVAVLLGVPALSGELQQRSFPDGKKGHVSGVILSHEQSTLKVQGDDDTIVTISITDETKVRGSYAAKNAASADALVPGLYIHAKGKGDEKEELVATKITFSSSSLRMFRQADARAAVVETRVGAVEARSGALENRAGQLETQTAQLFDSGQKTQAQVTQVEQEVGQVKTDAAQSEQRLNERVSDLDRYNAKYSDAVYFGTNSSVLSATEKQKLDQIVQTAKTEKGYAIQVAGYTDSRGNRNYNDRLSEARALAVVGYLQRECDIPLNRILVPAGMGATHAVQDNHTSAGRKMNRRVEVTVLVNEGITSTSQAAAITNPSPSHAE